MGKNMKKIVIILLEMICIKKVCILKVNANEYVINYEEELCQYLEII